MTKTTFFTWTKDFPVYEERLAEMGVYREVIADQDLSNLALVPMINILPRTETSRFQSELSYKIGR